MASSRLLASDICPVCGKQVEVLNGDVGFSMLLHMQSHKSMDLTTTQIDHKLASMQVGSSKSQNWGYKCPECKEDVEILNNDVSFSLHQHTLKHKSLPNPVGSEDQWSTSSGRSKHSDKKAGSVTSKSNKSDGQKAETSILDCIFNAMPPGLKIHKGFISENENGKAFCNACEIKVDSLFSIQEHLKTKSHEDKTIYLLTEKIPSDLRKETMEFISFYGSNLCCNLCRCKIDLCSANIYETVVSILTHNLSKDHLKRNTCERSNRSDESAVIVKGLSQINSVINDNKHLIDYKMNPEFKCKLCDKHILYDSNENVLLQNFISHFTSKFHSKCLETTSLLDKFNATKFPGKEKHNFTISKNHIYCTVCKCYIEGDRIQLENHVKQNSSQYDDPRIQLENHVKQNSSQYDDPRIQLENHVKQSSSQYDDPEINLNKNVIMNGWNIDMREPIKFPSGSAIGFASHPQTGIDTKNDILTKERVPLKDLLKTLPKEFRNIKYIVQNEQGALSCCICDSVIPYSAYNLQTHLEGKKHKTNAAKTPTHCEQKSKNDTVNNHLALEEILRSLSPALQSNIAFIKAGSSGFDCSVCNVKISPHVNCIEEHLKGSYHRKCVETYLIKLQETKTMDKVSLFKKIVEEDKKVSNHSKYLVIKEEDFFCDLCQVKINWSYEEELFKNNLTSHFMGNKHKKNIGKEFRKMIAILESAEPAIKGNKQYIEIQEDTMCCTVCKCPLSVSTELESFRSVIVTHFNGSRHKNSVEEFNLSRVQSATPTKPECTLASAPSDTIQQYLLNGLPAKYHEDVIYLKNSQIDGYLLCKLCNSVINPHFLKEHLDEAKHLQEKTLALNTSVINPILNPIAVRKMGSLKSLLGNIDNKISWPQTKLS